MTCILLLSAAALVEGMGLSFASALGATNHASGGASKRRLNQVAAAQGGAAQSLEMFLAAQGSKEGVAARAVRGRPYLHDTSDTIYATRQSRPHGHVNGAVVSTDYDKIQQHLELAINLDEIGAKATSERIGAQDSRFSNHIEVHDGRIWLIPATDACDDCMHALPMVDAEHKQHSVQLPLQVDSGSLQAPLVVVGELVGDPEHREESSQFDLSTDGSDTAGVGGNSQASSDHVEVHKLNGKTKLNGFEPSPARLKALRGRTLRRILSSRQSQVDAPEESTGSSGAETGMLHRELLVEAQEKDQNLFL